MLGIASAHAALTLSAILFVKSIIKCRVLKTSYMPNCFYARKVYQSI